MSVRKLEIMNSLMFNIGNNYLVRMISNEESTTDIPRLVMKKDKEIFKMIYICTYGIVILELTVIGKRILHSLIVAVHSRVKIPPLIVNTFTAKAPITCE